MAGDGRTAATDPALTLPPRLITAEAVVLDLRPASFATRGLAWALDQLVLAVGGLALGWLAVQIVPGVDEAAGAALAVAWVVTVFVVVPASVETLSRGRSVGKLAAGLRVVRDDGGPIRFRQALVRALVALPEIYFCGGSVALICSLANRRGKRIADLLAGTFVVRERSAAPPPPPPRMPAELAGWAHGADLGRIPDQLALSARLLLGRADQLHPDSRSRLALELAGQLARHVAPPPPHAVPPERFIAAVLAERRERDLVRLTDLRRRSLERAGRRAGAGLLSGSGTRLVGEPAADPGRDG